jgi:hypothetical protein
MASYNFPAEDKYWERIISEILEIDWGSIKIDPLNLDNI